MSTNRQINRARSVPTPQRREASHAHADIPLPSIENDASSPTNSDDSYIADGSVPIIHTPSTSASPDPTAPINRSRGATNESVRHALGRMNLASPGGIENLSDIADAANAVARGSDSQSVSLVPEDSRQNTPRRSPRPRPSISRALRHEVSDEELPQDAFHDPSFQAAYRDAKALMARTKEALGSASIHKDPDSTMRKLHKEATELARFQYPATRTVGFVGDSGVGKSSLLNCLLDCRGLARTSNSGEACTCVVTEYHYHGENGFDIEVELFSMEDIKHQLSEMLSNYRYFHLDKDEIDASEMNHCEDLANQARDTICSMLRGRLTDESFLTRGSESNVLERLISWASEARPSQINLRQSEMSLEACSSNLMELSSEPNSRTEPAKWPFIRKIKVFLNAHILSKGLVLVDLPGLRDLNAARRAITERFLLQCDEIFVICNIGRAVTDEGVHCVLELARQAHLSNVSIVCTRSDDIQADEAKRDWKGGREQHIRQIQHLIATGKRELSQNEEEIDALQQDMAELLDEERKELADRHSQSRRLRLQIIPERELELHAYLVNNRNSDVERELKNQYKDKLSTGEVRVFCVSNTCYWDNREKSADEALPVLRLSGILRLRKYCISIVAQSQRRIATTYMKDRIPALLAQIELWVQSGAGTADAERKETIRKALNEIRTRIEGDLKIHESDINQISRLFRHEFNSRIYDRRNISSWSEAATMAGNDWSEWHHGTYSAFCKNYGDHYTAAVRWRNWNEEAIGGMARDMERPWSDLTMELEHRQSQMKGFLDALVEWSVGILEDRLGGIPEITSPLINSLVAQKDVLWSNIERGQEEFAGGLRTLRTDAMSGLRTSLIGKAMAPAYRLCNYDGGTGSHGRRKYIINRVVSSEVLFVNLMRDFKNAFEELSKGLQDKLNVATADFLDAVDMTLAMVLSENVALESEQDPVFRLRVDEAVKQGKTEIERINAAIAS